MSYNPTLPTKYVGTNKYITFFVTRNRQPTGADYKQPETGTLYSVGTVWQVGKSPTTGVEGELWMLSKIVSNVAYWIMISGGSGPALAFEVDAATAPGVNPVTPDGVGLTTISGRVVAAQSIPLRSHTIALNEYLIESQYSSAINASDATKVGLCSFNDDYFTVDAVGFVNPTSLLTKDLHWPKFIVGDLSNGANYATIGAALAAATAGDTVAVQDGTYNENLTLKSGVSICGLNPSGAAGLRTLIVGKMIDNGATIGCTISDIALRTNSDYILQTTGAGTEIALWNCYIDATNHFPFSVGAGSTVRLYEATGGLQTTGIGLYDNAGAMSFDDCNISNAGASTTASTTTGAVTIFNSTLGCVFSTTSTGNYTIYNSVLGGSALNTAALTTAGTGLSTINNSVLFSGTASAISVGAGTVVETFKTTINSTNTNPVTGAGTYKSDATTYSNTGILPNTSTRTFAIMGEYASWTPVLSFGGGSTGITYAARSGTYTRIGNVVTFTLDLELSNKGSSTGSAAITGLPAQGAGVPAATTIYPLSATSLTFSGMVNARMAGASSSIALDNWASGGARGVLDDTAFANGTFIQISGSYLV